MKRQKNQVYVSALGYCWEWKLNNGKVSPLYKRLHCEPVFGHRLCYFASDILGGRYIKDAEKTSATAGEGWDKRQFS